MARRRQEPFAFYATGWLPNWIGFWIFCGAFIISWPVAYIVDAYTGGNYFYIRKRPLALLNKASNKVYIIGNFIFTFLFFALGLILFQMLV